MICFRHSVKKTKYLGYREDPFIFLQQDDPMWEPIQYVIVICSLSHLFKIFAAICFEQFCLMQQS